MHLTEPFTRATVMNDGDELTTTTITNPDIILQHTVSQRHTTVYANANYTLSKC